MTSLKSSLSKRLSSLKFLRPLESQVQVQPARVRHHSLRRRGPWLRPRSFSKRQSCLPIKFCRKTRSSLLPQSSMSQKEQTKLWTSSVLFLWCKVVTGKVCHIDKKGSWWRHSRRFHNAAMMLLASTKTGSQTYQSMSALWLRSSSKIQAHSLSTSVTFGSKSSAANFTQLMRSQEA